MSHPTRVRELKHQYSTTNWIVYKSHPTRVRELKHILPRTKPDAGISRTLRGCVN